MPFDSLQHVLQRIRQTESWQAQRKFQHLLDCWKYCVGETVAAHTRPTKLHRGTLYVSTSSAAWAQNLTFERQALIKKLTAKLSGILQPAELTDIRFSTAHWQPSAQTEPIDPTWKEHPSRLAMNLDAVTTPDECAATDPETAFQHWSAAIQSRSKALPLCPSCGCPTPPGELDRWTVCALCATQKWKTQ